MTKAHEELLQEFRGYATTAPTVQSLKERIAKRLHEKMSRYNWAGFYLVDPKDPNFLIVGPFAGSFTPKRITVEIWPGNPFKSGERADTIDFSSA